MDEIATRLGARLILPDRPGAGLSDFKPMIAAEQDTQVPLEAVKAVYERAREPKALALLPIAHFALHTEPWLSTSASTATDWFGKYL